MVELFVIFAVLATTAYFLMRESDRERERQLTARAQGFEDALRVQSKEHLRGFEHDVHIERASDSWILVELTLRTPGEAEACSELLYSPSRGMKRAQAKLEAGIELHGEMLWFLKIFSPSARDVARRLLEHPGLRWHRMRWAEGMLDVRVEVAVAIFSLGPDADLLTPSSSAIDVWPLLAALGRALRHDDRSTQTLLEALVAGAPPGSSARRSALKTVLERGPTRAPFSHVWGAMLKAREPRELFLAYRHHPERLMRSISEDELAEAAVELLQRRDIERDEALDVLAQNMGPEALALDRLGRGDQFEVLVRLRQLPGPSEDELVEATRGWLRAHGEAGRELLVAHLRRAPWPAGLEALLASSPNEADWLTTHAALDLLEGHLARAPERLRAHQPCADLVLELLKKDAIGLLFERIMASVEELGDGRALALCEARGEERLRARSSRERYRASARILEARLAGAASRGGLSLADEAEAAGGVSLAQGGELSLEEDT